MESPQSQPLPQVNEKNNDRLFVKVFQLFSKGGIKILDEHKELVSGFPETNSDGSAEAKADSQDKSSLSFSGAGHNKLVDILHIAAAYVNQKNNRGRTPLHLVAETGDTELVDLFLKAGADVGAEDHWKQTPLHLSAENGNKEAAEVLLKAGANVHAEDYRKQTPLHSSAGLRYKELVEALLQVGANVDAQYHMKQTPVHLSARFGYKEVIEIIFKAGANVHAEGHWKQIPLHLSARLGYKEVIEILLTAGANSSLTKSKKHVESFTSSKTKTEHTETISATFTDLDTRRYGEIHTFPNEDSSKENGQDDTSRDSSTLLTPRPQLRSSSVTSPGLGFVRSPPPPGVSHDPVDDRDLQELSNIRTQAENYWAKFSPETTEGCETSCSSEVKAAFQAGRVNIYPITNITLKKITKITNNINHHYEPGASLNISHAENVAPGGQIVVHQNRKVKGDEDEDDSFDEDDTNLSF